MPEHMGRVEQVRIKDYFQMRGRIITSWPDGSPVVLRTFGVRWLAQPRHVSGLTSAPVQQPIGTDF